MDYHVVARGMLVMLIVSWNERLSTSLRASKAGSCSGGGCILLAIVKLKNISLVSSVGTSAQLYRLHRGKRYCSESCIIRFCRRLWGVESSVVASVFRFVPPGVSGWSALVVAVLQRRSFATLSSFIISFLRSGVHYFFLSYILFRSYYIYSSILTFLSSFCISFSSHFLRWYSSLALLLHTTFSFSFFFKFSAQLILLCCCFCFIFKLEGEEGGKRIFWRFLSFPLQ